MSDRVFIFDTTLRDGEQSPGATMNQLEKLRIARQLESMGVDIIEAGFPAASDGDFCSVREIARSVEKCQVAGLCRAVPSDIDRAWEAIREAAHPRIHTFIATSPLHMKHKLQKEPAQVLEMAQRAVRHACGYTANVEFSAEDASRSEWDFLARITEAVIDCGATTVNIPDTVGYAQPDEFAELIRYLRANVRNIDRAIISVHCHNDLGLAVANTMAAIRAGARQAEVTLSGIGERAGNAALEEVVMNLNTRRNFFEVEHGIDTKMLFPACRLLSHIIGQPIPPNKAVTGANAFAHESGIHQDGVLKDRRTYEIMTPESVGRVGTDMVLGKHSGRHAIKRKLDELGYRLSEEDVTLVADAMKRLADIKKTIYDEDLEAIVLEEVFRIPDRFRLNHLTVHSGTTGVPATAAVILDVNGEERKLAQFGVGPVDATFNTIAEIIGLKPSLERFQINAISGGTDALGEVTVKIREGSRSAVGRGADPDIIIASAKAYINAMNRLAKKTEETSECPAP
ncbi:2-isopropylmalate synthase [Desulfobaculum xiamenense]|uniref:2-isopropylmalate synthase n=1 Tax=Desulfobaculum xiamenense TaxID=995050 RepID=A0A846QPI7_9BACT|nr:2-isopropylmalate synthase [Desulfobaculum xiamenense]NJB67325.1 2-isopropylmalate synthase [Desulfobaculum xiamenense]